VHGFVESFKSLKATVAGLFSSHSDSKAEAEPLPTLAQVLDPRNASLHEAFVQFCREGGNMDSLGYLDKIDEYLQLCRDLQCPHPDPRKEAAAEALGAKILAQSGVQCKAVGDAARKSIIEVRHSAVGLAARGPKVTGTSGPAAVGLGFDFDDAAGLSEEDDVVNLQWHLVKNLQTAKEKGLVSPEFQAEVVNAREAIHLMLIPDVLRRFLQSKLFQQLPKSQSGYSALPSPEHEPARAKALQRPASPALAAAIPAEARLASHDPVAKLGPAPADPAAVSGPTEPIDPMDGDDVYVV
jgi:hypothetical protein